LATALGACAFLPALASPAAAITVKPANYFDLADDASTNNDVVITALAPGRIHISDTAGVTPPIGPSPCTVESAQAVVCEVGSGFLEPGIVTLDVGDDSISFVGDSGYLFDVFAGPGNDLMAGDLGPDDLVGGPGNDTCLAEGGDDFCRMGPGADRCVLGAGADGCNGKAGPDVCLGQAGNDVCSAGRGRDRCDGGGGRDDAFHCEGRKRFEFTQP
jgi:Ca2+-binding RTX toxin-like protein